MKPLRWNHEKSVWLQEHRGVLFEEVVFHIEHDEILEVRRHPNPERYPRQKIFVIELRQYVYLVPFVEDEDGIFLKTIIPSRKAKKELGR
jgi:hypothetical protein